MKRPQEENRRRLEALTRLAILTREKAEPETYRVYLDALEAWNTDTLVEACRRLPSRVQWFPKLAEIVEVCQTIARERELIAEGRRLAAKPPAPVPQEKLDEFLRQIRQFCSSNMRMPDDQRAARRARVAERQAQTGEAE